MMINFELEPGEELLCMAQYHVASHSEPFACMVTNRSLLWSRTSLGGPKLERTPIAEVRGARVVRVRPYVVWFFAPILFLIGIVTTYLMFAEPREVEGSEDEIWVSGAPLGVAAIGLVLPFAARRRFALEIDTVRRKYRWKPPIVVGQQARADVRATIMKVTSGLERVGIPVAAPDAYKASG